MSDANDVDGLSVVVCLALSALGGVLEVVSAMGLAYPQYLEKKRGTPFSSCQKRLHLAANLFCVLASAVAVVTGSWFGPVSLSVPAFFCAKLLGNLVVMSCVLRIHNPAKAERVGTFILAFVVLALADVGPAPQPEQDVLYLISRPLAMGWIIFLCVSTAICILGMLCLVFRSNPDESKGSAFAYVIYTTGQVAAAVVGTSAAKMFALTEGAVLAVCVAAWLVVSLVNVASLALAATALDQSVFVPLQTASTLLFNMVTGLLVWEDFKVIHAWAAYVSLYLIMLLAVYQVTTVDLLHEFSMWHVLRRTQLSKGQATTPFGEAVLAVIDAWKAVPPDPAAAAKALAAALDEGVKGHRIGADEFAALAKRLIRAEPSLAGLSTVGGWMREARVYKLYAALHPEFVLQMDALAKSSVAAQALPSSAPDVEQPFVHELASHLELEVRVHGHNGLGQPQQPTV